jgi:hypothetical protein
MEAEDAKERAKQREEEEKAIVDRIAHAVSDVSVSSHVLLVPRHIFTQVCYSIHINSGCLRFCPFFICHRFFWHLIQPRLL